MDIPRAGNAAVAQAEVAVAASGERALLTHEWLLRQPPDGDPQLFAKPDDRWEHNDVARRCYAEVEQRFAGERRSCAHARTWTGKLLLDEDRQELVLRQEVEQVT